MTQCLARFAKRVSTGLGSCSAVKLKCLSPIPISTTPDATIVQMTRDRIRFSFATDRRAENSHLQLKDRAREYKLLKNLAGSDSGRVADSAFDSLPAIVAARQVGNPESQLTCLVAGYPERKRLCVQRKTKIPEFNSLCRYNNA